MKRKNTTQTTVAALFRKCAEAINGNVLITKPSEKDKEYHFQNWLEARLIETGENYEQKGRNTYPDFSMVATTDGFEVKGLAYPGRVATFDSNSQVPTGRHNGRTIYYVFGRYPDKPDGNTYPVVDLVICHGDFLNADHEYIHENKSVRGFGSYGDIMIRDRKMYVVPTPFRITQGTAHEKTLILPANISLGPNFICVGDLCRKEAETVLVGYEFDLRKNTIIPESISNPNAGKEHLFKAWRLSGSSNTAVVMNPHDGLNSANDTDE